MWRKIIYILMDSEIQKQIQVNKQFSNKNNANRDNFSKVQRYRAHPNIFCWVGTALKINLHHPALKSRKLELDKSSQGTIQRAKAPMVCL